MAWREVRDLFRAQGLDTPELDARLLAQEAFGLDAMALVRREREPVPALALARLNALAARRLGGEPVSRILGHREFWGLDFTITPDVLDPRPETELLVGEGLALLDRRPAPVFADLGTGSGAIAIALASGAADATGYATDLSPAALGVAKANAERLGVADRLQFLEGSWWQPLAPDLLFDLIVSNPPYIATAQLPTLQPEVRGHDPQMALDGGWDGVEPYRAIAAQAPRRLKPDGVLMVEIGSTQAEILTKMFRRAGFQRIEVQKDLAGLDRVIIASHS